VLVDSAVVAVVGGTVVAVVGGTVVAVGGGTVVVMLVAASSRSLTAPSS
jgi:hypothetical protein